MLWSDSVLLAINKPAGLLAVRGGFGAAPYVQEILEPVYGRLWVVHRLDRQTSGAMAMARSASSHRSLNAQFQSHTATKVYHALVVGRPSWDERTVSKPLRRDGDRRHRTVVDPERGKQALTHLRVLERFRHHALLEATPHTGRTHQIRAHLSALGLPIVADALYGGGESLSLSSLAGPAQARCCEGRLIERSALHALELTVVHPTAGTPIRFEAPYPPDLERALRCLRATR